MNTIERFYLSDVRCFAGESEFNIRPLTFLVGENSTGKSTVLGCMQAFMDFLSGRGSDIDFNHEPYKMGVFSEIARNASPQTKSFSLGFKFSMTDMDIEMRIGGRETVEKTVRASFEKNAAGTTPTIKEISWTFSDGEVNIKRFSKKEADKPKYFTISMKSSSSKYKVFNVDIHDEKEFLTFMAMNSVRDLASILIVFRGKREESLSKSEDHAFNELMRFTEEDYKEGDFIQEHMERTELIGTSGIKMESIAPIRSKPRRTYDPAMVTGETESKDAPYLIMEMDMLQPELWKEVREKMNKFGKVSGLFSSVNVKRMEKSAGSPFQIRVKVRGPQVNLQDVGYGISQVLLILVKMFKQKETHFLIQQPEIHIHSRALAELTSLMIQNHKQHNNVFIIETHNDYMVNRARIEIARGNIDAADVSVIYFSPKGNTIDVHNITFDEIGNMRGVPAGYREFFMIEANRLLGFRN